MVWFRPKVALPAILTLVAFVAMLILFAASTDAAPSASTAAPLQPIKIFTDFANGQWVGSGNGKYIENNYGTLPIDTGETLNGLPSYRIHTSGDTGWWIALLAGSSWESYSIEPYNPNGMLEFNIKGAVGGEQFDIAINDIAFERNPKWCEPTTLDLEAYVTVTTSWQHVQIPLADLLNDMTCPNQSAEYAQYPGGTFDLSQLYTIVFKDDAAGDMTVWLNEIEWTSPDNEPEFAPIKVNQHGYTPNAQKYALISGFSDVLLIDDGDFFDVRRAGDGVSVYQGRVGLLSNNDAASGEKVLKADFSLVEDDGEYVISVNGLPDSEPFSIGADIYDSLIVDSARYYYLQRQGIALAATHAGIYERGVGHPQDNAVPRESDPNDLIDVMQGWYDAGDYGKYVNAGATAVSDLLWSYEMFPGEFPDNHLNIPEIGNNVPDILDEVRWELEWMLKMQAADGGFYHMVKSKGGDGRSQWDSDTTPDVSPDLRFIRDSDVAGYGNRTNVKPTSVTGDAVAALAHAAVVFEPFDAAFANEMLLAAADGWAYLEANQNYISPIIGAPYTIPYVDFENPNGPIAPDVDDRVWAAAALFRATGNTQYRDYFDANYGDLSTSFDSVSENAYGPGLVSIPAVLTYFAADNRSPAVLTDLVNQFNGWRDHMLARSNNAVWQTTLLDEDYYWGSNYPNLTTPLALAVGTKLLGTYDQAIIDLSHKSLNYTLGINPLQFSYVSGYGENALERPFSQIYNFDNKPGVPPGMLAGGANEYNNAFLYSEFPAKSYQDNAAAWSTNEHTVYWNAVVVFHAALASEEAAGGAAPTPTPTPDPNATATPTPTPVPPTATPTPLPPTATPTPDPGGDPTEGLASSEQALSGNLTNDYSSTHAQDFVLQVVCEQAITTGPQRNRYDFAEHIWQFDSVPEGEKEFVAYAWKGSEDLDDFVLSYSTDNATFTDFMTLGTTWNVSQTASLPAELTGTLYIRLMDTVRDPGTVGQDCAMIDQLLLITQDGSSAPTAVTTSGSAAQGAGHWLAAFVAIALPMLAAASWYTLTRRRTIGLD